MVKDLLLLSENETLVSIEGETSWEHLHFEFFNNFSSSNTKKCYLRDIKFFYSYLEENINNLSSFLEVKRIHLVAYRNFLEELNQAPKTVCRKFSSLSSYFDFLVEKGLFRFNPCDGVKRPKQAILKQTNDLSDEKIKDLLQVVDEHGTLMHQLVIYLLFFTGIRKQELINLKIKDFENVEGSLTASVKAKGNKRIIKLIDPIVETKIKQYKKSLENCGIFLSEKDPLIIPSRNPNFDQGLIKHLNPKTVDYILKKYCRLAGIYDRISPHSARASYIGSALENGADLLNVSIDVGHSSVKTTQEYDKRRKSLSNSPVKNLGYLKDIKKSS
ncbi:MAG: hypothetical protein CME61_02855 [Halobacteriovoraceae bacterium]|nr:hypothetical protein [Halobacteriovoraceae bacterium]|tara:strand:- start:904 stop:1893 length:990 start_codon:yes stop_codon:yes gene_type:complete